MDKKQLVDILLQLRAECLPLQINASDSDIRAIMEKYDMIFLGNKFNSIYSHELCCMMNEKKNIDVSVNELNAAIPGVCSTLGMKIKPLVKLNNAESSNPIVASYEIELY